MEIDLSSAPQYQLFLDCNGTVYDIEIFYEKLPAFCSMCHSIGHDLSSYHQNKALHSDKSIPDAEAPKHKNQRQSRSHSRAHRVWKPK